MNYEKYKINIFSFANEDLIIKIEDYKKEKFKKENINEEKDKIDNNIHQLISVKQNVKKDKKIIEIFVECHLLLLKKEQFYYLVN